PRDWLCGCCTAHAIPEACGTRIGPPGGVLGLASTGCHGLNFARALAFKKASLRDATMTRFALPVAALFIGCALPLGALAQAPVRHGFPGAEGAKRGQPPAATRAPAPAAKPAKPARPARPAAAEGEAAKPKPAAAAATPARAIACSGQFAKDASHLKLAQAFG